MLEESGAILNWLSPVPVPQPGALRTNRRHAGIFELIEAGYKPAVVLLTVLVAAYRALRGRPIDQAVTAAETGDLAAAASQQPARQR